MIKNVIFDLGVVLLEVNYKNTIEAFSSLGLERPEEAFSKQKQDEFFRRYERGQMSESEFLNGLSARIGGAEKKKLKDAWCAMLGELPQEKYDFIRELKLKSRYRLFILSNTNYTHQVWFEKKIHEQYNWKDFSDCFEFIGYSHQINQRKPDKAAFKYLLEKFDLHPEETLFIDDTLEHVESARKLGILAIHYRDGDNLSEVAKLEGK